MKSSLRDEVLVLNKSWTAVGTATVRKIVKKLFTTSCFIIDTYIPEGQTEFSYQTYDVREWLALKPRNGEKLIHAVRKDLVAPIVCMFDSYEDMPKMDVKYNRQNMLQRDDYCCQYCGVRVCRKGKEEEDRKANEYTIDHVIPKRLGGKLGWTNSVVCCHRCNNKKGGRTPEQAHMRLMREPVKPKAGLNFIRNSPGRADVWDKFLHRGVATREETANEVVKESK